MTRYVQRLGRVFEALQILDLYPSGLALSDLAHLLGCDVADIRADLAALNAGSDLGPDAGGGFVLFLAELAEPVDANAEDDDDLYVEPEDAVAVRLQGPSLHRGAGGLTVADLGAVLQQAQDLLQLDPADEAMARVVAEIRSRWLPGVSDVWRPSLANRFEHLLAEAVSEHRQVWLRYERIWRPGTIERVVQPYAIVRTHRGFEVDAGTPVDPDTIKTYLIDQIRDAHMLPESFEPPPNVEQLCSDHRRTTDVTLVVPKDREWAAEYLSEAVVVEARDDETQLRVSVLEPVRERVGLLVVEAGEDAFVASPAPLVDAAAEVADRLWAHHGL
jgi:predicted DNA-binding transcriptional regulator YafY